MRLTHIVVLVLIPVLLAASPALAQDPRVVDESALSQALASKADDESAQRALVQRVLDRADVRGMASRMGLSVERANSAVATAGTAELSQLAEHARAVETKALAGGASTVVISTTTLLLVLIVVILLAR